MAEPRSPTVIDADYLVEARSHASLPAAGPPEIAIAGRSNVGKSTLINALAARKSLARTSKTPGRTRGIICYGLVARLPDDPAEMKRPLRLIDLPGYGYAQVSRTERKSWGPLVEGFVKGREVLKLVLVLVDGRRGVEDEERQLVEWLASVGTPARVVVTKVDKLSATERGTLAGRVKAALAPLTVPITVVSAVTGDGIGVLWGQIARALAVVGTPG